MSLRVEYPKKLYPLLKPARYKGAYGGRGGAKSHFFAEQLILRCYAQRTRAVGLREVQNSIRESVRQLLVDKISKFGLESEFEVLRDEIRCARTGSLIVFRGMQSFNAENIKSLEDFDVAWVEEAQTLSEKSLRLLRPTIRKDGSELWFSWNPRHDTDPVDVFFRGQEAHPDAVSVQINHGDNPWFPNVLKEEMEHDRRIDADMAAHVWDGAYELIGEGAYYARILTEIENKGRVTHVPIDEEFPVHTAWDLGVGDDNAIWFFQVAGNEFHIVDFYVNSGYGLDHYAEVIKGRAEAGGYERGLDYVPHDAKQRSYTNSDINGVAKQRIEVMRECGLNPRLVPIHRLADGISAVRQILPHCWFHRDSTLQGFNLMRRYRRAKKAGTEQLLDHPLKDPEGSDHVADAFRTLAMGVREVKPEPKRPEPEPPVEGVDEDRIIARTNLSFNELRDRNAKLLKRA